jgi:hypothetical protein
MTSEQIAQAQAAKEAAQQAEEIAFTDVKKKSAFWFTKISDDQKSQLKKEFEKFKSSLGAQFDLAQERFLEGLDGFDKPEEAIKYLDEFEFVSKDLKSIIAPALKKVYQIGWQVNEKSILSEAAKTDKSKEIELNFAGERGASAEGYVKAQTADLISGLDDTTRKMVRDTIQSSIKNEETWPELQERLANHYGFSTERAEVIARTESGKAYNVGWCQAAQSSGVVAAVEVSDGDDYDEPCSVANGSLWSMEFAMAHPLSHPNCRREFAPYFNPDLIPKQTPDGSFVDMSSEYESIRQRIEEDEQAYLDAAGE